MIKETESAKEKDTKVTIFGREYHIRSPEDPDYTRKLAEFVDKKMAEVDKATHSPDVLGVSILTLLHLANELFKVWGENQELKRLVNQRIGNLLELVSEEMDPILEDPLEGKPQSEYVPVD